MRNPADRRHGSLPAPWTAARRSSFKAISTLTTPADFRGKNVATPQFGNTQDVAARAWLLKNGMD